MIFFDTETCGLYGPIVLLQFARDDGNIEVVDLWTERVTPVRQLLESFANEELVGFNLSFDWFHVIQMWSVLRVLERDGFGDSILNDIIPEYAIREEKGRFEPCLKPRSVLDLMLHARKGPYQSTMDREDITIKRVPTELADKLAKELGTRVKIPDIYFSRKQDPKVRWQVVDIKDEDDRIITDFKNVVLRFAPSSALKALAYDALGIEKPIVFSDIELPSASYPEELGYAPFCTAIGIHAGSGTWPDWGKIRVHINHWINNPIARQYAEDDVRYTRLLYKYFNGVEAGRRDAKDYAHSSDNSINIIPFNDDDSILACMVACVRWRGFAIDIDGLKELRERKKEELAQIPFSYNSPAVCKRYLYQVMNDTERLALVKDGKQTTKGIVLEEIAKWKEAKVCGECKGEGCNTCAQEGFIQTGEPHLAAVRAQTILNARHAQKEVEIFDKLLTAGRFHASFKVIGALSSRMSGDDGLNAQGIKRGPEIRSKFYLADPGYQLCGGDFAGFEVVLADAAYGDPVLRSELKTGKKIHALFGQYLFPPMTYEQILKTKGLPGDQDKYSRSKNGVFALLYGGEDHTLVTRVGVSVEAAATAYRAWCGKYKKWAQERGKIFSMFCSMRQPGGIGTKVEWHEPHDYIETMLGFRRYFTLENRICRALFGLAEDPPKEWLGIHIRCVRRDREQTVTGASRSACFAAAFQIQAENMRAAANHVIQGSGAQLTKKLQTRIWGLQPHGVHEFTVLPMNVHDEIMCPALPGYNEKVRSIVDTFITEHREQVPLLEIEWHDKLLNWGEK